MPFLSSADLIRYEAKVLRQPTGCWLWVGARAEGGYGKFTVRVEHERLQVLAHRLAWQVYKNIELANVTRLQNTCGFPSCVNPDHWPVKENRQAVTVSEIDCDGDDPRIEGNPPETEPPHEELPQEEAVKPRLNPFNYLSKHQ